MGVIIIDPGHGGIDSGTVYGDIKERDKALAIAGYTTNYIVSAGLKPFMTRTTNKLPITNTKRLQIVRQVQNSKPGNITALVAIHLNGWKTPDAHGQEILYWGGENVLSQSVALAHYIKNEFDKLRGSDEELLFKWRRFVPVTGHYENKKWVGDRWSQMAYHYNEMSIPACLVETGFLSNQHDRRFLCDPLYQKAIGVAIGLGIKNFTEGV